MYSPPWPPTACLLHPAKITVMNSCAIYCTSRRQANFTTEQRRTYQKKSLSRILNRRILHLLHCMLSWLTLILAQYYNAQYTTVTTMAYAFLTCLRKCHIIHELVARNLNKLLGLNFVGQQNWSLPAP